MKKQEIFIQKCQLIWGNKYDYSKTIFSNIRAKVTIICREHGQFDQLIRTHLKKQEGCPDCKKLRYRNNEFNRICSKCITEKDISFFHKNKNYCKVCTKKYIEENKDKLKKYSEEYYIINKEKISNYTKKYHEENKEKRKEYAHRYYKENKEKISNRSSSRYHANKDKFNKYYEKNKEEISKKKKLYYEYNKAKNIDKYKSYYKKWREENKDRMKEYRRINKDKIKIQTNDRHNKRAKIDILFKLTHNMRTIIRTSIFKYGGFTKKSKTHDILGCSFEEFKIHIESKFKIGMSWENHGEWHLDHKTPLSWANSESEIYELNHYTNFQPLWAIENQQKGNRYKSY